MTPKISSAYDEAVKYLNIKMYSRGELESRLLRKKYEPAEVGAALEVLTTEGLLNDHLYAETYLENLISYRTFGYYGIRNKLLQKKLDRNLVDRLLKRRLDLGSEKTIARRFLKKTANTGRARESLIRALRQKGFRTEVLLSVIQGI